MESTTERNYGCVTETHPIVWTETGPVMGENRDGIAIFRGIPYGADCSGENRFLPPQPHSAWEEIRDCTVNGPIAVQPGSSISGDDLLGDYFSGGKKERFGVLEERQGENCLVLNVVSPGLDEKNRPVVVYIHGGGFLTGSGTLVLGADQWAREEDIVLVGINHRLNLFGYLYLGHLDAKYEKSGNAGMLDLVLALEWIRDNIANFGGNPQNVTIMGESGGGMKVSTLMAMQEAQGLFCRAIVESGSNIVGDYSIRQAEEITSVILKKLGLTEEKYQKLLDIPTVELIEALQDMNALTIGPVGDDIVVPSTFGNTFWVSPYSDRVSLLIGNSLEETVVFLSKDILDGITWDNLRQSLLDMEEFNLAGMSLLTEKNVDQVIREFRENFPDDASNHIFARILSADSMLGRGSWYQAAAKSRQGAPVYSYVIAYQTKCPGQNGEKYAWHTADLPLQMRVVLNEENECISRKMAESWAAFARTGSPDTEQLKWKCFTEEEPWIMVFDNQDSCCVSKDPYQKTRTVFGKDFR